jgi:hypothetical protein
MHSFTISPADEKIFSEGTNVAGTVNTRRADNFVTLARLKFQTWLEIR